LTSQDFAMSFVTKVQFIGMAHVYRSAHLRSQKYPRANDPQRLISS